MLHHCSIVPLTVCDLGSCGYKKTGKSEAGWQLLSRYNATTLQGYGATPANLQPGGRQRGNGATQ
jgi:hypothetical protein